MRMRRGGGGGQFYSRKEKEDKVQMGPIPAFN